MKNNVKCILIFLFAICVIFFPVFSYSQDNLVNGDGSQSLSMMDGEESSQEGKDKILLDVVDLTNVEIHDVLKIIAKKSGLNIVARKEVEGVVTIYLKNVDGYDALRIILESNNLAFAETDGVINVMTASQFEKDYGYKFGEKVKNRVIKLKHANPDDIVKLLSHIQSHKGKVILDDKTNTLLLVDVPEKLEAMLELIEKADIERVTKIFKLKHVDVAQVLKSVEQLLTSNIGKIETNEQDNEMVITDTPQRMEDIIAIMETFDKSNPNVSFDAKIIQIILNDEHQSGVDWEAIVSDYQEVKAIGEETDALDDLGSVDLSVGTISKDDYGILLEALDTVGLKEVVSTAIVTSTKEEAAKIIIGYKEDAAETTTTATGPVVSIGSGDFTGIDFQISLQPKFDEEDNLSVNVKPFIKAFAVTRSNKMHVVKNARAETELALKKNATIIIAGLLKENKISSVRKVPLLGDIPFLGAAFRRQGQTSQHIEMIIFITPQLDME